jgi:hypothetical protein
MFRLFSVKTSLTTCSQGIFNKEADALSLICVGYVFEATYKRYS